MQKILYDLLHTRRVHRIKKTAHHLFVPQESNNFRAKILHHKSLTLAICILLVATVVSTTVQKTFPDVLGVANTVTVDQLLNLTNQERSQSSVGPLVLNEALTTAAERKAQDMFAKDYWAHNAPDGTTPWVFIKGAGYNYLYAGENLARGYTNTQDAINAWMASPDHRRNMLSKNYRDVGFAIETGKLSGEDTVLIVEELGSTSLLAQNSPSFQLTKGVATQKTTEQAPIKKPLLNSFSLSEHIAELVLGLFILAFVVDMVAIERKRVVRFVGHNEDHIFFLLAMLTFLLIIFGKGAIL